MRSTHPSELKALVRLLDEEETYAALIEERLLEAGRGRPSLLKRGVALARPVVRTRAEHLVARLRFQQLEEELTRFASLDDREMDLETGAFLVARYGYPDLDATWYSQELDRIAGAISPRAPRRDVHGGRHRLSSTSGFSPSKVFKPTTSGTTIRKTATSTG